MIVSLACLVLAGCRQETLYVDLTQTEANEMISLMYASGLPAEKLVDKDGSYSITTSREAFAPAMALLQANGLPHEQFESMGNVFKKEGFVSSSLEERARLNFALSQEISRTVSSIDGVIMARVHLVIPERERLKENRQPASASVFIKHRPEIDPSEATGKIKSLVINGVENLPYENVTVAFFEARPYEPSASSPAPPGADGPPKGALAAAFATPGPTWLALPLILCALGAALWYRQSRGASGQVSAPDVPDAPDGKDDG